MGFFESLFYTIWRGVAIGILISAPMGPVGILCIQRTLDKGRKTGLYTGIGAAISDLIYCILTGFGLSFIEEFLERNQNVIQLAGSIVLIAFAVYLFKKNPASSLKTPQGQDQQVSPHKNILGGFFFTFSNPLILFLIIGLFARFNFSIPEISFYYYIAGYVAIFFGAILWWEFVTFTVNKLRAHFNLRSMWLINRIIGVIILIFALVGIITGVSNLANAGTLHWNNGRGYSPFLYATSEGIIIENETDSLKYDFFKLPQASNKVQLKFRARNINGNPSKRYTYKTKGKQTGTKNPHWGFFITSLKDTVAISVKGTEKITPVETIGALQIDIYQITGKRTESIVVSENVNPYDGDNLWDLNLSDGIFTIMTGDNSLAEIYQLEIDSEVTGIGFFAGWGGKVKISDIDLNYSENNPLVKDFTLNGLDRYLEESEDEMEGYWTVFDRDLEESLIRLGGDYSFVCLLEDDNYKFHYLDGANVNNRNWATGDVKIIMVPSAFEGIYNVEWIDSMKESLSHEIKAQKGEGNTLTIQFPYQSSKIRLRKMERRIEK
ncbi:MAG: LysE family translocator [Muribaculaceae bacterium]|nr:LysE family translocator [Muribaculaceae bacterium]